MTDVTVIAEWGQAPNFETALRQAHATLSFNGQIAKWQMFSPDRLVSHRAARYWEPMLGGQLSQMDTFTQNGSLTDDEWRALAEHCQRIGIGFLVTPFDLEAVDLLADIGVSGVKIASADITYRPLLEKVGRLGVPVTLSAGASSLSEVDQALQWLACPDVTVMACDLVYPCELKAANLQRVSELANLYPRVGYSDHTMSTITGAVAVSHGATVLEKHCTLNVQGVAPDNRMALTPRKMGEYAKFAAQAFTLMSPVTGDPEHAARVQARRSWHALRDLPAGHTLSEGDVIGLRPCLTTSLSVDQPVDGLVLTESVKAGSPVPA
jgi:N,N'-diacetyllegionaminate synthase